MWKSGRALLTAVLLLMPLAVLPVHAIGMRYLEDAPFVKFSEQDKQLYLDALHRFLDSAEDGGETEWQNAETGSGGQIRIKNTFERDGLTCRRVWVTNHAGEETGAGTYVFCKSEDGTWKVAE